MASGDRYSGRDLGIDRMVPASLGRVVSGVNKRGTSRFLLAVGVVLFHYWTAGDGLMDAHATVKIFIIMSGFYMAMILDQKYVRASGGMCAFAFRRFLRLYPRYAVVLR